MQKLTELTCGGNAVHAFLLFKDIRNNDIEFTQDNENGNNSLHLKHGVKLGVRSVNGSCHGNKCSRCIKQALQHAHAWVHISANMISCSHPLQLHECPHLTDDDSSNCVSFSFTFAFI